MILNLDVSTARSKMVASYKQSQLEFVFKRALALVKWCRGKFDHRDPSVRKVTFARCAVFGNWPQITGVRQGEGTNIFT